MRNPVFKLLPIAAAALLCLNNAQAGDAEGIYHGYLRSGAGTNSEKGAQACFNLGGPTAENSSGRLGNECDTYGEFGYTKEFAKAPDGTSFVGTIMANIYNPGSNVGNAKLSLNQYWVAAKNVPFLNGATAWIGNRFNNRPDVHMMDWQYVNMSGTGVGIEGIAAGPGNCIGVCVKQHVWDNPMEAAWTAIRNSAPSRLRVDAWDALWGALQASIWDCIAVPIGESVKACANDSAQSSVYGQHDAYWLAYYDYFQEEGLRVETEKVQGLIRIASHAGWFAPHAKICWICERPRAIVLNSKGELHSDNGPALDYPDGWCLYAANGKVHFRPVTS